MVRRGQLPVDSDNRIPQQAGLAAFVQQRTVKAPTTTATHDDSASDKPKQTRTPSPPHRHDEVIEVDLERKRLGVEMQKLRMGRETGELVPRDQVAADARATCTAIRNTLLALPARVALLVESLVAASDAQLRAGRIQRLLEDEINLALEALHEGRNTATATIATSGEAA